MEKAFSAPLQLVIFTILSFNLANATFEANLCRLFKRKTILRDPVFSNLYIKCEKNELHVCDDKDSAYDPNQGKCIQNDHQNQCLQPKTCKLMANPIDCSSFYFCLNGLTYSTDCEENHYFDEVKQMCVPPEKSKCIAGLNNICKLVADGTRFIDPKNPTKFHECKNGKQTTYSCGNIIFHVELGKCAAVCLAKEGYLRLGAVIHRPLRIYEDCSRQPIPI